MMLDTSSIIAIVVFVLLSINHIRSEGLKKGGVFVAFVCLLLFAYVFFVNQFGLKGKIYTAILLIPVVVFVMFRRFKSGKSLW